MNVVIIGLGTASFAAMLAIKKYDRIAKITVIDKKEYDLLHACGLPFAIEGKVKLDDLKHSIDAKRMGINVILKAEVLKLNPGKKEIEYIVDGKNKTATYDKLLLDTGSVPYIPAIKGLKENSLIVRTPKDVKSILNKAKQAKNVVIIGAGAIGIETAYALKKHCKSVRIIESLSSLFPRAFDPDTSLLIEEYLRQAGILVNLNEQIKWVEKNKIQAEKSYEADLIICATGVRPNIRLAFDATIKTSQFGISVDKHMQTSIKDIYAAGDCTESWNKVTGKKFESQLATTAYKQGTIAGSNIAKKKIEYNGSISTFASVIGNLEVAATGLNSYYAEDSGIAIVSAKALSIDKPEWFKDTHRVVVKIIADKKTKRIVGAQAIGHNASSRINVVSTAISAKMTLNDLSAVELTYCPALSQTYDVLHQAVDIALRKIK